MVFSDFSRLLCKPTHFSIALSKGAKTTTWIWNLHADAHDFDIQPTTKLITRKVFSSGNAHLSLVFFWLGALHFSGAYFANFSAFILDPKHCFSSAHLVSSLVGQDILNSDVGGYFQGIYTTAGLFQLWRSQGMVTQVHLKYASSASLIGTITCIAASYFSMHLLFITSIHHLPLLLGLASLSYCSHQIHISSPINRLLDSGVDPAVIPLPQDLLIGGTGFSIQLLCGGTLQMLSAHHFYLGIALIAAALSTSRSYTHIPTRLNYYSSHPNLPDGQLKHLCIHLLFAALGSFLFAHHAYAMPVYPYLASDYPTTLSLFYHHMNIAAFLAVGAAAHASIFMVRSIASHSTLNHRCLIIAHLSYVALSLGLHSFGLYIHNDTLQSTGVWPAKAFAHHQFSDNSIQLKPVFAIWAQSFPALTLDIEVLDGKVVSITQDNPIHAFTIHVTLLILLKGILYSTSSRLVSDKSSLGFRYPCDGPGRGGTCQISPYDHLYLAIFWMYNSLSVVLFHFSFKMQSDLWGVLDVSRHQHLVHLNASDFSVNSTTINGWLRNFLWSQAAQVIQSYGTSISAYGLIFLCFPRRFH
eukprot:TRINITY_DN1328_c0_g1_i18.p1 TRINITY_DN1328_c0_g1~~TRINITY_DN1328_c0_g1_i18.p1  ORF type:complete len:583 (+),score=-178.57 TRINITY_DN1328_c0_g1_i18:109-1857(+)